MITLMKRQHGGFTHASLPKILTVQATPVPPRLCVIPMRAL
jgi:hypothetical protein